MKTAILVLALLCTGVVDDADNKAAKEAEHIEKLVKQLAASGTLIAEQTRMNTPKRFQKKVPAWMPPTIDIRSEQLQTGSVGFVRDVVFVDEVLGPNKFRATIYVKRPNADRIFVIIENHSTKDYTDKKQVTLNGVIEVTGTEKTAFGETLLVFTQREVPMDKIKEAVLAK